MKIEKADVLIIGSGGAGLRAAIELFDNKVDVLVVGKSKKREAHTRMAAGGINAALGNMDPEDSWQQHAADTIKDGGFINDPVAVKLLCKHAPEAVKELDKWGMKFNKTKGKITQRFFGAAKYRRSCFSGDITGLEILNTLVDQVDKRKIRFKSEIYIFAILEKGGKVNGAIGLDTNKGEIIVFHAKKVVLATGGHSRMFSRSSSYFWENNGDGIALAYDLGARFMDMEMFQFHPTGMVYPKEVSGLLVTEAVRGEGGVLLNTKGERFMEKYDKKRMELSARDIVARANYMEIEAGRGTKRGGVYLDISNEPCEYIKERLPQMHKQFGHYDHIDICKDKMEVAPTAHYSMGGIKVDHKTGKTDVPNLYAIGEVTAGAHGGNRLGGNSLAEILVFGKLTGKQLVKDVKKAKDSPLDEDLVADLVSIFETFTSSKTGENPTKAKEALQRLMWDHVGVIRDEKSMQKGLNALEKFKNMELKIPGGLKKNEALMNALDFKAMLPTCEMILRSALMRSESRAAHYRKDKPKTSKKWLKNILCSVSDAGDIELSTEPVPKMAKEIEKMIPKEELKVHLLE